MKDSPSPFFENGEMIGWAVEILPGRIIIFDLTYSSVIETAGIPEELVMNMVEEIDERITCEKLRSEFRKTCIEKYGSMKNAWKVILKINKGK